MDSGIGGMEGNEIQAGGNPIHECEQADLTRDAPEYFAAFTKVLVSGLEHVVHCGCRRMVTSLGLQFRDSVPDFALVGVERLK